jgi:hypothetical protein
LGACLGKAPLLVFTDGWSPWQPDMPSQGRAMQQHALDMGVLPESLRVTDPVELSGVRSALL